VRITLRVLLTFAVLALVGCRVDGGSVPASGRIVYSNGERVMICIPADGSCEPLVQEGTSLPKHDLQVWPSYRSSTGTVVFEAQAINGPNALVEVDLDGVLVAAHPPASLPRVSPDGSRLAFRDGERLAVRNIDGSDPTTVTTEGISDRHPAVWLTDESLVFQGIDGANRRIELADESVSAWPDAEGLPGALSADGSRLFLVQERAVVELSLAGGELVTVREAAVASLAGSVIPSPDGRWLAYVAGRKMSLSEAKDLHVLDRESGKDVVLEAKTTVFGGFWLE
jgi:hypothetical protein